ncbi:MAG TPA: HIT domain-containing protein [Candidatus Paceibacterota bacterium]|nr:HIT domain-containing protein [Candidatus Paceibacterota bacterium]
MLYNDYLKTLNKCPFYDEIHFANQLVADNKTSALIISLAPYHKHHLLIIPKRHLERIVEISDEEMSDIIELQRIGIKILYRLGYSNMSVLVREGENIGKSVKHLHYHIIPNVMIGAENITGGDERSISTEEEILEFIEDMREAMEDLSD